MKVFKKLGRIAEKLHPGIGVAKRLFQRGKGDGGSSGPAGPQFQDRARQVAAGAGTMNIMDRQQV